MSLDLMRLEKVRHHNGKTIARCPACAESGRDNKGDHLVILADGKFGCVVYPGKDGHSHRQRVFALVGVESVCVGSSGIRIRRPPEVTKDSSKSWSFHTE